MDSKITIVIFSILGGLLGYSFSSPTFPIAQTIISDKTIIVSITFVGGLVGLILGVHLTSKANQEDDQFGIYAFYLCLSLGISIPTYINDYNGFVFQSVTVVSAFFGSVTFFLLLGWALSALYSKSS